MTELKLYKFIKSNSLEYHWHDGDVILFIDTRNIREFMDMLGFKSFDDEGIECVMKYGYVCVNMVDICMNHGIEPENVFEKEKQE